MGLFLIPLVALVVMILPGTTSASSAPASLPDSLSSLPEVDQPILLGVSLRALLLAAVPASYASAEVASGTSPFARGAQIVALYGFPGICAMGALGCEEGPAEAIARTRALAAAIDEANGDRETLAALHLIVAVAQPTPGPDGSHLYRMPEETLQVWLNAARRAQVLLFLDVQIGWADPLREVVRLNAALREPFVHLALDPEFATRAEGLPPGEVIGTLDAADVNAVQRYLAAVVRRGGLPPKALVLHQFMPDMLTNKAQYESHDEVDVTVDMDGFGAAEVKIAGYEAYARTDAEYAGFKLFFDWDVPAALTPADLQAMSHPPDFVLYQ